MTIRPVQYSAHYSELDALREAVRQTERQLEAQQAMSSAADQRALAFCALVFVVVALSIDALKENAGSRIDVLALGHLLLGAGLAALSAKPSRFYASGGRARGFKDYLISPSCGYLLAAVAERNDDHIDCNDNIIKRSARIFQLALFFAATGIAMLFIEAIFKHW